MAQPGVVTNAACAIGVPAAAEGSVFQPEAEEHPAVEFPKEGELVILYGSREMILSCVLKKGGICRTRLGNFDHEDIMKTRIGHKVYERRQGKWLVVLRPTPDLHTLALRHRTQIIYHADISLILSLLDVRPGKTIVEAGTGSGSLSYSLAVALRPEGRLFTFEFHEPRWQEARDEFMLLGISKEVQAIHRDVCADGFCPQQVPAGTPASPGPTGGAAKEDNEGRLPMPHSADGVFLDLPSPWLALKHADQVLKGGGRLVTFSPCVEQLHKTFAAAQELGFQDFQAFEILAKPWGACISRPSPDYKKNDKPKRKRNASPQVQPEEEEDEDAHEKQDGQRHPATSFPALLSHFLQQPFSQSASWCTAAACPREMVTACSVEPSSETPVEDPSHISSYHYQLPMKGHTGYVACCIKPSEDERFQPLP
ncbi:tRNA (adenine-N(1)-)-methyltransferase catalytic subunit, putative [Eimeria praecox]|uniref:tRNA (adenine(58)-N(1))-methyltransferase n=1 Tax=Eimeria praecox TaxID=51316 RepID=U6H6H2_9EIME|nr:tRNA (adenine-N(1)-)-methyltransferase catalytic subunit, putative [Eimeria praecox]